MANTSLFFKSSLALLIAGGVYAWWQHTQQTPAAPTASAEVAHGKEAGQKPGEKSGGHKRGDRPTPVTAITVQQADVPVLYSALGTAIPSAVVTVTSRVNGQLTQVLFKEGQLVKQGQLLAKIDPRPFETALGQIQGQAARNQALLKNSQIDLERFKTLQTQDSIASQQVDSQASLVQQYQGTVQADHAAVENAKLQLSFTNIIAPVSGRIGLRQVDAGNNITTTNPIAVINAVRPIHVVFTLPEDSISRLIKHLQNPAEASKLTVEAWDKSNTQLLAKGKLASLDNQIDTTTGTLKLKAAFENHDDSLFPNQFVNVKLHGETLRNASVVPANAIQHGPQGAFVYVVHPAPPKKAGEDEQGQPQHDGHAHQKAHDERNQADQSGQFGQKGAQGQKDAPKDGWPKDGKDKKSEIVKVQAVTIGYSDGELVAVTEGLKAGDRIVSSGVDKLKDGAKVRVKRAEEAQDGNGGNRHKREKGAKPEAQSLAANETAAAPEAHAGRKHGHHDAQTNSGDSNAGDGNARDANSSNGSEVPHKRHRPDAANTQTF